MTTATFLAPPTVALHDRHKHNRFLFGKPGYAQASEMKERNTYTVFGDPTWMQSNCASDTRRKVVKALDRLLVDAVRLRLPDSYEIEINLSKEDYEWAFHSLIFRQDIASMIYTANVKKDIYEHGRHEWVMLSYTHPDSDDHVFSVRLIRDTKFTKKQKPG